MQNKNQLENQKGSQINNEAYFADFKSKMLHYAKENPKTNAKKVYPLWLWYAAAAIILMIVGMFAFINFEEKTQKFADIQYNDSAADRLQDAYVKLDQNNIIAELGTENEFTQKPIIIQDEKIQAVGYEMIEKQVLDDDIDETELLEMIPEDVLDDWLAEYDI